MKKINVLDYKIEINKDDYGDYIAMIPKLGCLADGETISEAIDELIEVAEDFIRLAEEDGKNIPIPEKYEEEMNYSGKLTLRIPKLLHKMVTKQAEKEGCSINQLITTYVSLGIGNEFGKKHLSINLDTTSYAVEETVKQHWREHAPNGKDKRLNFNIDEVCSNLNLRRNKCF